MLEMDIREDDMEDQAVFFVEACKAVIQEWEGYKHSLYNALWPVSENRRAYYEARAKAKLASFEEAKKALLLLYNTKG